MNIRPVLSFAVILVVYAGAPRAHPWSATSQKVALVTVVADAGARIKDLTATDFVVTEDNARREVIDARISDDPLSIALLIDTSQPPLGVTAPTQDLRRAVQTFVHTIHAANPEAQISLTEIAGAAVTQVPFTANVDDLDRAIGRLVPNPPREAVLLEAIVDAGRRLARQPPPRRAIVSIDFNSPEGSAERTMKDAVESVHDAGATLWAVSVRGTSVTTQTREEVLNKITQANGGLRVTPVGASGLEASLTQVANTLTSQYIVTFSRPDGAHPKTTIVATATGGKVLLSPWMR